MVSEARRHGRRAISPATEADGLYWSPDGTLLAVNERLSLVVRETETQEALCEIDIGKYVSTVAWVPGSETLLVEDLDDAITLWDAHNCDQVGTLEGEQFRERVDGIEFSPDGQFLAIQSDFDI